MPRFDLFHFFMRNPRTCAEEEETVMESPEVVAGGKQLWQSDKNIGAVKDPEIMSRKGRNTKETLKYNDFPEYKLLEESDGSVSVRISDRSYSGLHILRLLAFMLFTIAAATVVRVIFQVTLYRVKSETRLTGFPLFLYGSLQESLMEKEPDDYTVQAGIRENYALMEDPSVKQTHGISFIQDIVLLPEEILFLVRLPSADSKLISHKSLLSCSFSPEINTTVNGIDYLQFGSSTQSRAAVRCQPPPPDTHWSATSVALVGSSNYSSDLPDIITAKLGSIDYFSPIKWDYMVYESFATDEDIVLFAKGINNRQGLNIEPKYLRCIFNNTIETRVTLSAQEIFRCEHPSEPVRYDLIGSKITLGIRGKSIPSVAYYEIPPTYDLNKTDHDAEKMNLCACTMVFNVAKYIREWVIYHSHLGVKHFFLYDNNSEDNLEETLAGLSSEKYMIKKHPWPWAKTQESGFSHCALMAKDKCQWMMYTDVDEFVFSPSWLKQLKPKANLEYPLMNSTSEAALWQLVTNLSTVRKRGAAMIGQISLRCRNFGPSGLNEHPQKGVTQGYTCREKQEKRYKSILLLEAASPSLLNVIHRFQLKKRYRTVYLNASKAVINHYKYQAWSEFKAKFRRRVSAYVVDWKDSRNPGSQDRTPGLGNRAIKPHGWENMFCEVNDTALKEYAERVFSLNEEEETGYSLEWQ